VSSNLTSPTIYFPAFGRDYGQDDPSRFDGYA
jgi:hypothetical protein